ncbi:MAG: ABC transporter permease [Bacteroidia bacterium]
MNKPTPPIYNSLKASAKQSYFKENNWVQFKKNKNAYYSYKILLVIIAIALLSPFIATDLPWYCNYRGVKMYPAFSLKNTSEIKNDSTNKIERIQYDITDWKQLKAAKIIFAPIPYSPNKADYANSNYVSPTGVQKFILSTGEKITMPFKFRHWLGTNKLGEDVLSGLLNGTCISLVVGIFSMAIASFIGIGLGALAGYFGNKKLRVTRGSFFSMAIGLLVAYYYAFYLRHYYLIDGLATSNLQFIKQLVLSGFIFFSILFLFYYLKKIINKLYFFKKQIYFPVDAIILRVIEVLASFPLLILIILMATMLKEGSIMTIVFVIGFTFWVNIARLTRAEFLKITKLDYIQSAQAMGLKESQVIIKHALPNALAPVTVAIVFGVAAAILIESSLSFLGIGVAADRVTWGSLLYSGREQFNAWWLVVFPGLALFTTLLIINFLADGLRNVLDPKED